MKSDSTAGNGDFGRLRLIARVSLWFGVLALLALLLLLFVGTAPPGGYVSAIAHLSAAREQLPLLMAIGGLVLAIGTALTTWLIAIYSSFRVAGPLHRLCIDLEQGIDCGQLPRVRIRASDDIQAVAQQLESAVGTLYHHYDAIAEALGEADGALRQGRRADAPLRRARELLARVRR